MNLKDTGIWLLLAYLELQFSLEHQQLNELILNQIAVAMVMRFLRGHSTQMLHHYWIKFSESLNQARKISIDGRIQLI